MSKDMKNFHACNDFLKIVIDINVVTLYITLLGVIILVYVKSGFVIEIGLRRFLNLKI